MAGIGLVFNPRAGKNRRDPEAATRLARQLGDHGVVAVPRSLDELSRAAEDFRRLDIHVLGIAGGDGTNHVTLTGFHDVYGATPLPTVAFLRGGTMNTVANSLGLPKGRTEGLLDRLVRRYLETPDLSAVERRMLDVDGKLGFLWGIGALPNYLTEYYATGTPSPWTALKTLARGAASAMIRGPMVRRMTAPVEVEIVTNSGEHWPMRPYLTVGAGTIPDLGLGFKPFYLANESRDAFHLLTIHTDARSVVLDLPRIKRGAPMREGNSTDRVVGGAVIRTGAKTLRTMIDGDVLESTGSEIRLGLGPVVRIATMQ